MALGSENTSQEGGWGSPLRPANNVGRNCFRIYAIQQEFAKAHELLMHRGGSAASTHDEYPVLSQLLREVSPSARG